MAVEYQKRMGMNRWFASGEPFVWISAAAVTMSAVAVIALLALLAVRGFGHFWPAAIYQASYQLPGADAQPLLGERVDTALVSVRQIGVAGQSLGLDKTHVDRSLFKLGNRDISGRDFGWYLEDFIVDETLPRDVMKMERREWGDFYGYLKDVRQAGEVVAAGSEAWPEFQRRLQRAHTLADAIETIEKKRIGAINYALERLRLQERGLELELAAGRIDQQELAAGLAELAQARASHEAEYAVLEQELLALREQIARDSATATTMSGQEVSIPLAGVVHAYQPNAMNLLQKIGFYCAKLWEFLSDEPREANTEGGIFPAIFGTVMMVMIMSVLVTPFGVIAAVYLKEYARQNLLTQIIRVAVNNLAGVPSIVYGVFGLGFFVYFVGANIDQWFFPAALPAPTFGTPGLLWASLTLALLTLPVVIVSTEEGLARVPRALREGSLALGATKAETLWKIVLPMSSPAIMTGLILAVARAAGEVAPLMLVGVVKLAPSLPVDGNFPFVHLDRKFMHLGFHIYDVGFQSPNVEAARPLVYATALLLVIVIVVLNLAAIGLRNHLREKYRSLEM
ncbi:MAG: phosphate ABC transporter permease PstA [Spongiibacteraceae bacterium]|jgi:phosphate transport system permease protein|nr:phosphate ABC transporter permease PstA [Spongiibacteraceae bacterium]